MVLLAVALIVIIGLWQARYAVEDQLADITNQLHQATSSNTCTARDTWQPGTSRVYTLISDNQQRTYRVHLPENFSRSVEYPLVLGLSGKGEYALTFEQAFGLNKLPVIAVYPQATLGEGGVTAWQGAPYASGADDVEFINQILDKLEGQLCIKKSAIYSVGFSNGGGMSWLLSCRSADRIAAFAMIAGAFYEPEKDCHPQRPTPILNIHGDKDKTVPYFGSQQRKLPAIDSWVADRARSNGCNATPATVTLPYASETATWSENCRGGATVQNIRLLGIGHTWPSSISLKQPAKTKVSDKTADILWRFFNAHTLN